MTCMSDRGKSPTAYKADKVQLEPEDREPLWCHFLQCHQHPISLSFCLPFFISSFFCDLPPQGMREGEEAEGAGNLQDSADTQQLRALAYIKEMKSRDGGGASRCRQL